MKIFLLTHERELHRATNTGSLALDQGNEIVERVVWERVKPDNNLTWLIENNEALLLYSADGPSSTELFSDELFSDELFSSDKAQLSPVLASKAVLAKIEDYENIIIIDSTWQEARKIFNHSPYLKKAPQFTLQTASDSLYKLRANQPKGGLCTIECIIEVLRLKGKNKLAAELLVKFSQFNG